MLLTYVVETNISTRLAFNKQELNSVLLFLAEVGRAKRFLWVRCSANTSHRPQRLVLTHIIPKKSEFSLIIGYEWFFFSQTLVILIKHLFNPKLQIPAVQTFFNLLLVDWILLSFMRLKVETKVMGNVGLFSAPYFPQEKGWHLSCPTSSAGEGWYSPSTIF